MAISSRPEAHTHELTVFNATFSSSSLAQAQLSLTPELTLVRIVHNRVVSRAGLFGSGAGSGIKLTKFRA